MLLLRRATEAVLLETSHLDRLYDEMMRRVALRDRKQLLRSQFDFGKALRYTAHRNACGEDYLAEAEGATAPGPKMLLRFTCTHSACDGAEERTSTKIISRQAYDEGVVLVHCECVPDKPILMFKIEE